MQTHDHTIFCGDFIAERQVEEYEHSYPEISTLEENVVRASGQRFWRSLRFAIGACFAPFAFAARSLLRIARLIRWASEPREREAPKQVYPGAMLEFVVFGFFVVGVAVSTLL
jgi:hypothetical protein